MLTSEEKDENKTLMMNGYRNMLDSALDALRDIWMDTIDINETNAVELLQKVNKYARQKLEEINRSR